MVEIFTLHLKYLELDSIYSTSLEWKTVVDHLREMIDEFVHLIMDKITPEQLHSAANRSNETLNKIRIVMTRNGAFNQFIIPFCWILCKWLSAETLELTTPEEIKIARGQIVEIHKILFPEVKNGTHYSLFDVPMVPLIQKRPRGRPRKRPIEHVDEQPAKRSKTSPDEPRTF